MGFKGFPNVSRVLVENGADLSARNGAGATALHFAAMFGRLVLVDLLAEAGTDVDATDGDGRTPEEVARFQGHEAVAERLRVT
jgi:hypothetical protein